MISTDLTIGFIGAGNMATALIEGLLATRINASQLWAADTAQDKLATFADKGINTTTDNAEIVRQCSIVVLAVKPQVMAKVVGALQPALAEHSCLLISIAAGISCASLQQWTHPQQAIVRCMPNTPALVQAGASGLFANALVSAEQKQAAQNIMEAVGIACWLDDEAQIDAVTALSGSGPAYFFLLMEAMQDAAVKLGLPADVALRLCLQTAFGAAKLALNSDVPAGELRRRVTSPGGTTEAAIKQFEAEQFHAMVERALGKANTRSQELART
ncbi:MAG: pyrroline-5-carboxylate reductase [Pseudomonadota bacterium]